jgi:hypothetical protein
MAQEHTGGHGETADEYIQHHLTNLQAPSSQAFAKATSGP